MEDEKGLDSVEETLALGKETVEKIIKFLQGKGIRIDTDLLSKQVDEEGNVACSLGQIAFQTDSGIMTLQLLQSEDNDLAVKLNWDPAENTDIDIFFGLEDELFEGFMRRRMAQMSGPVVIVRSELKKDFTRILERGIECLDFFFVYKKKENLLDELMLTAKMKDRKTDGGNREFQFKLKEDGYSDNMPVIKENVIQNALNKIDAIIDYEQALSGPYVVVNEEGDVVNLIAGMARSKIGQA